MVALAAAEAREERTQESDAEPDDFVDGDGSVTDRLSSLVARGRRVVSLTELACAHQGGGPWKLAGTPILQLGELLQSLSGYKLAKCQALSCSTL